MSANANQRGMSKNGRMPSPHGTGRCWAGLSPCPPISEKWSEGRAPGQTGWLEPPRTPSWVMKGAQRDPSCV